MATRTIKSGNCPADADPGRDLQMAYPIDTNIGIHARDGTDAVLTKLAEHDGDVLISSLSLAGLGRGADKNPALSALRRARLDVLMRDIPPLAIENQAIGG